jgi:hypothetical protein
VGYFEASALPTGRTPNRQDEPHRQISPRGQSRAGGGSFQAGKWQRYYGFVGSNHIARVPADDIEFDLPDRWGQPAAWISIGAGFQARLALPPLNVEVFDDLPARLPADRR